MMGPVPCYTRHRPAWWGEFDSPALPLREALTDEPLEGAWASGGTSLAYARFGWKGSDVYVYSADEDYYVCASCPEPGKDFGCETASE